LINNANFYISFTL